jgi:hypothetical protein
MSEWGIAGKRLDASRSAGFGISSHSQAAGKRRELVEAV